MNIRLLKDLRERFEFRITHEDIDGDCYYEIFDKQEKKKLSYWGTITGFCIEHYNIVWGQNLILKKRKRGKELIEFYKGMDHTTSGTVFPDFKL